VQFEISNAVVLLECGVDMTNIYKGTTSLKEGMITTIHECACASYDDIELHERNYHMDVAVLLFKHVKRGPT
jgi:hypothetical protein